MKMDEKLNQVQSAFIITSFVLLFQTVRNISNIGYIGILFTSYAWLYITYLFGNKKSNISTKFVFRPMRLLFLLSILWIPFISLLNMPTNEFLVSLPRFLVTLPYLLFCYIYNGFNDFMSKKVLKLFVGFSVLASLTVPFQIVFGPIPFFSDPSYREGLVRYSSLAGNLTILGTAAGIALAIVLFSGDYLFNKSKKNIVLFLLLLSMLMTLQKAAVVNILICYSFYFFIYGEVNLLKKIISIVFSIVLMLSLMRIFDETEFVLYIERIINYTFSGSSAGTRMDIVNRIWYLPYRVITYNNVTFIDYIFGIGFPSLAGTMGNPHYPMAHNNFVDLLLSGGLLHLISFLYLLLKVPYNVVKKYFKRRVITSVDRMYSVAIIIIILNMLIGAATFYQPVTATIVYFLIFSYDKLKNNQELGNNPKSKRQIMEVIYE